MADFKLVKQLREETNVSYAICQDALKQADGDIIKAREFLREKGADVAAKKASRALKEGRVFSYVHHNQQMGAMVVLMCETDFVAKNELFQELGNNIAMQIASTNPENIEELLASPFIKDPSSTVDQLIKDVILKMGENTAIGEFQRFEI
ncbi:hypothetical protein A3D08_03140 [Candidatus Roizmanbacteria bacterium RIFCSPHIGHO2_02_FULL_43_11]|uniref:Elongation factor Ts n=1 Tax=Candidatus Roizmanbacteria bacterium RIFCSPHIGHO2_02_FULL_43_11 TaxID=1802043 RepID=A0A1F7HFG0_9BACT|nr:MAG: hypothetical protein A3D08_03140 [Candidatus Roizmanbacteria bacterium RIFCSPHIGHO2_02_FULL_43_11]